MRHPYKAMLRYELLSIKHQFLFTILIILVPAISLICFKLFFDSALSFGFKNQLKPMTTVIDMNWIPKNIVFIEHDGTQNELINNIQQQIIKDNKILKEKRLIKEFDENRLEIKQIELEQAQINKKAILALQMSYRLGISQDEAANRVNISLEQYQNANFTPSLFNLHFVVNESTNTLTYSLTYNQSMYDLINPLKNDSYTMLTYIDKYRNPIGTSMQIYIENAILISQGKEPIQYTINSFPNKQVNIMDPSIVSHSELQLVIITLTISLCCYLARDRNKQQKTLRILSLDEHCYQIIRMMFGTIIAVLQSILVCVSGYLSNFQPFCQINIAGNIVFGVIIGLFITPFCQLISIIFGKSGAILPIIVILVITFVLNFFLEIMIYMIFGAQSIYDQSIMNHNVYYILSIAFPNVNLINILDLARQNTKDINYMISIQQAFSDVSGLNFAKQSNLFNMQTYSLQPIETILTYSAINYLIIFVLNIFLSYIKPEPNYPGVNPFKLFKLRNKQVVDNQFILSNIEITYKKSCIQTMAIENFNCNFEEIGNITKLGLLGVSGAGKTSLLNIVSGQQVATSGQALVLGYNLFKREELYMLRKHIGLCPQANENVLDGFTITENINIISDIFGLTDQNRINQNVTSLQLTESLTKNSCHLSGGMLRRLSLLNCIIPYHDMYIFDEITSGLDPFCCVLINKQILEIDKPFILSTHDMKQVKDVCNYMIIMRQGHILCSDSVINVQFNYNYTSILINYDIQLDITQYLDFLNTIYLTTDYRILYQTNQQCKLLILAGQLQQLRQLTLYLEQLQLNKTIIKFQLERGSLTDIFIQQASVENNQENIILYENMPQPQVKQDKIMSGLFRLFWKEDINYSMIKLPFSILFVSCAIVITAVTILMYNFLKVYVNNQFSTIIKTQTAIYQQELMMCCGLQSNTEYNVNTIHQQCLNQMCFSDGFSSSLIQSPGLLLDIQNNLPIQNPSTLYINQIDGRNYYNTAIMNNLDYLLIVTKDAKLTLNHIPQTVNVQSTEKDIQNIILNLSVNSSITGYPFNLHQSSDCLNCEAICYYGCVNKNQSCYQECANILLGNTQPLETFCYSQCTNQSQLTENILNILESDYLTNINQVYNAQMLISNIDQEIYEWPLKNAAINIANPKLVPHTIYNQNQQNVTINSLIPNLLGVALYQNYLVNIKLRQNIKNGSSFDPLQLEFWNPDQYFAQVINSTQYFKQPQYSEFKPSEIADSQGWSIKTFPFGSVGIDINKITNQQTLQQPTTISMNKLLASNQITNINGEVSSFPYYPDQYKSQTFNVFLAVIQSIIVALVFCLPIIKTASLFTHLKITQIENLLNIHGYNKFQLYGAYLIYASLYIALAAIGTTIIAGIINLQQAKYNMWLFCIYLFNIGFSCCVLGMVISKISSDKKHAVFTACMVIIITMFISMFLMNNNFLILVFPHLFAIHRMIYLNHTDADEYYNCLICIMMSIILFTITTKSKSNQTSTNFEVLQENQLFNYNIVDDIQIHTIDHKQQEQLDSTLDLYVSKLTVIISNIKVIENISFKIKHNQIFGLLGLSGSGKSVTIKTLIKQLIPFQGKIYLKQKFMLKDITTEKQNSISYVPQTDILFEQLTVFDHIKIFQTLHGHKNSIYSQQAVQQLGLEKHQNKIVAELSGGMKRRLSILIALMHTKSQVIAFDECSTGLSPDLKIIVWNIINIVNKQFSKSIIISSHYMEEIDALANNMIVLNKGQIAIEQSVHECTGSNTRIIISNGQEEFIPQNSNSYIIHNDEIKTQNMWSQIIADLILNNKQNWITQSQDFADIFMKMYERLILVGKIE
ncbi:ABC_transporter family protein [Hexamita inflata]|uniref:ABC transporter family protein n=1 Tax=Hexamita inflata TaxID=28002 RepID=A0AA86NT48_9EUKA|nr:ABC transporter family protein [Hexamita inflata]